MFFVQYTVHKYFVWVSIVMQQLFPIPWYILIRCYEWISRKWELICWCYQLKSYPSVSARTTTPPAEIEGSIVNSVHDDGLPAEPEDHRTPYSGMVPPPTQFPAARQSGQSYLLFHHNHRLYYTYTSLYPEIIASRKLGALLGLCE